MEPTCSVPVLLGVLDSSCPSLYCSPYESKIGGYPDCFPGCSLSSPPSCPVCGSALVLLVQVYCPLESSVYHRIIHVLCCVQPPCHNESRSWLVLRSQFKDGSAGEMIYVHHPKAKVQGLMDAQEWCGDADDWGCAPSDDSCCVIPAHNSSVEPTKDMEKQKSILSTVDSPVTSKSDSNTSSYSAPFYPPAYIQVVEEPSDYSLELRHANDLLKRYQTENPEVSLKLKTEGSYKTVSRGKVSEDDGYEKATPKHGDRAFLKFRKQLARYPQQILRYSRQGTPLQVTDNPSHKMLNASCKECGASSMFEFQLMPTFIYMLQEHLKQAVLNEDTQSHLKQDRVVEFDTVLVYTCSKSCWAENSQPRVETAFIQKDCY